MFEIITAYQYNDNPSFQMMLSFIVIKVSISFSSSEGSYLFTEGYAVVMQKKLKIPGLVHNTGPVTDWTIWLCGWSKWGNLYGLFSRKWRSRCRVQQLSHRTGRTKRSVANSPVSVIILLVLTTPLPPFDHQLPYSASNNSFIFACWCCLQKKESVGTLVGS